MIGGVEDVDGREAEQPNARIEQSVLAAVVLGEGVAVGATVIFEAESLVAVVQVRPPDNSQETIANGYLRLRPRQAR